MLFPKILPSIREHVFARLKACLSAKAPLLGLFYCGIAVRDIVDLSSAELSENYYKSMKADIRISLSSVANLCKYLAIIVVVLMVAAPAHASADRNFSQPKNFYYRLIMSEDDAICKPLARIYNKTLADLVKLYRQGRGNYSSEGFARGTNFEFWEPQIFAKIGFVPPPVVGVGQLDKQGRKLLPGSYLIDLFDEGSPRSVIIYDKEMGNSTYSQVDVLKKGAAYRTIYVEDLFTQKIDAPVIDPDIIDRSLNLKVENTKNGPVYSFPTYELKKWPGIQKSKFPTISRTTTRVFLKSGVPYFIDNQYVGITILGKLDGIVLVYRLTPDDRDDVCYLKLTQI